MNIDARTNECDGIRDDTFIQLEAQLDWITSRLPYREYLTTRHWQHTRRMALEHFGRSCALCGADDKPVHVHHRTYERRGHERLADLTVLCGDCHRDYHKQAA